MENQDDLIKKSASIIEEIEGQLNEILSTRRKEIESELEEKIERDRQDAKDKMDQLEKELSEEKDSLNSYRSALAEFDKEKQEIKEKIKDHLAKAAEYQPQIEDLASKTMSELKIVMELNQNLEELNLAAVSCVESMKEELKDKVGIIPPSTPDQITSSPEEWNEKENIQSSLDLELEKLKKIKELLDEDSPVRKELTEFEANSLPETLEIPDNEKPPETSVETMGEDVETEAKEEDIEREEEPEENIEAAEEIVAVEVKDDSEKDQDEDGLDEDEAEDAGEEADFTAVELEAVLEKYRKSVQSEKNIKLTYFENKDKLFLDVKDIFDAIDTNIEETEKLYDKLSKTHSPKEQFFTKQEIVWRQETLREFFLKTIDVCEKKHVEFSPYISDQINMGVIGKVMNKVSQENWSNEDNFASFIEFSKELKSTYNNITTPKIDYLKSLVDELEIAQ